MDRTTPHSARGIYSPYTELAEKHTQLQADLRKLVEEMRESVPEQWRNWEEDRLIHFANKLENLLDGGE